MADKLSLSEMVAEEIRVILTRRRISARRLAADLGFSQSAMSARLTGTTPIDLNELARIAKALDVEIVDLLPARREGRVLAKAAELDQPNVRKARLADRPITPRPDGHPHHTIPAHGTRRPARVAAALAHV